MNKPECDEPPGADQEPGFRTVLGKAQKCSRRKRRAPEVFFFAASDLVVGEVNLLPVYDCFRLQAGQMYLLSPCD